MVGARAWALFGLGDLPGTVRVTAGPPGVHSVAVAGAGGIEILQPAPAGGSID